jgi:uncharacterized protein YdhG (YjbR/CyaY superfamily)
MKVEYKNIDEYIALQPEHVAELLEQIRQKIRNLVPEATETISYGIPTFKTNKNLVHFAGFKNHIGFFPGASGVEKFKNEITNYKTSKGTIQFQLNEPIPFDLIEKIVKFRIEENKLKK